RIAGVMQERFLPEIGGALDAALAKIVGDLRADIGTMVRGSIEETLRMQLKDLRLGLEAGAGLPPAAAPAGSAAAPEAPAGARPSDIMPALSAMPLSAMSPVSAISAPPAADTELAKSFEPAAIEARWYPFWEQSGCFAATLDDGRPAYCI